MLWSILLGVIAIFGVGLMVGLGLWAILSDLTHLSD